MKHFDSLSLDDRKDIVRNGKFAVRMHYFGFNLSLYILPKGEFAEVWYNSRYHELVDVKLLNEEEVDKWLKRIKLSL